MATTDRPMVNVYEGDPPGLVYRPMNDDEYAQWQADQQAASAHAEAVAEVAMEALRAKRDIWLGLTDWIGLWINSGVSTGSPQGRLDEVTANAAAWTDFRQALFDYPASVVDPLNPPPFPAPPAAPLVRFPD